MYSIIVKRARVDLNGPSTLNEPNIELPILIAMAHRFVIPERKLFDSSLAQHEPCRPGILHEDEIRVTGSAPFCSILLAAQQSDTAARGDRIVSLLE